MAQIHLDLDNTKMSLKENRFCAAAETFETINIPHKHLSITIVLTWLNPMSVHISQDHSLREQSDVHTEVI